MGELGSASTIASSSSFPMLWLLLFFLAPFFIVFRISLSTTAIAMPPYEPVFSLGDGWAGFWDKVSDLLLRELQLPDRRSALCQRLYIEPA